MSMSMYVFTLLLFLTSHYVHVFLVSAMKASKFVRRDT